MPESVKVRCAHLQMDARARRAADVPRFAEEAVVAFLISRRRVVWNFLFAWGPALAMAGAIFFGSSRDWQGPATGAPGVVLAKAVHVIEYAILCALVRRALVRSGARHVAGLAFAITVAFAASDEIHQMFTPGRTPSPIDLIPDATGALLALLLARETSRASARLIK